MKLSWIALVILMGAINGSAEEHDLGSLLDEVSEIATKTKLNIDYQPSVVSVLHAEKLKKIGIRDLHEALGLLPGIETSILHTGWKQVIVRGTYNPDTFVFDKYKLYIDGVDVGSDLYSTSYYYLDFPVELIDRIEVLRGAASTIYGPGAFSGAINVITKSSLDGSEDSGFGAIGSYGYTKGGFVKHYQAEGWKIGVDGYFQRNSKKLNAGTTFVAPGEQSYLRSDYDSLEGFNDFSVGMTAKNNNWTLIGRYKEEKTENFYGLNETLEPIEGGYQKNRSAIIELQNTQKIGKNIDLETKVGTNLYEFSFNTAIYNNYLGSGINFQMNPTYRQLDSYMELNLKGGNIDRHQWLIGTDIQRVNTLKNLFGTTIWKRDDGSRVYSDDLIYLDGKYGFLNGDHNQWVKSLYLQDIFSLSETWDISLNGRVDNYDLFDSMYSYRFGSVNRLNEHNSIKTVLSRSCRAPSYVESFQTAQEGLKQGNPNLEPEIMDIVEIAYIFKDTLNILRTNLFYSQFRQVIDSISSEPDSFEGDYSNHRRRNAKGIEFEMTHNFRNGLEVMGNFSYVQTQYFTPDYYTPVEYRSPEISEVLIKGYLILPVYEDLYLNSAWYYSGPKRGLKHESGAQTTHYGSTMLFDETIVYDIDTSSNITLSIKNLFNDKVVYPSYQAKHDGLIREGRNWLLTYEKHF